MKNINYSEDIDGADHYIQCIHFDCQCSHFSMWFAEIAKRESAAAAEMMGCLCWYYMNKMNKTDITDKINCKHCSDRVDKKIEISEIDHMNKTDNYCWNCYLNDTVAAKLAVLIVW